MLDDFEVDEICRDEDCEIVGVHPKHRRARRQPQAHHRPKPDAPWKRSDRHALLTSIMKSTSGRVPKWFQEIAPDVRDDYGNVTDRTIWRGIKTLVERGHLLKLDLGLAFAAYMRPIGKKRPLGRLDETELRDYMLSVVEINPTTKRG
jgi:hypothetical protein